MGSFDGLSSMRFDGGGRLDRTGDGRERVERFVVGGLRERLRRVALAGKMEQGLCDSLRGAPVVEGIRVRERAGRSVDAAIERLREGALDRVGIGADQLVCARL